MNASEQACPIKSKLEQNCHPFCVKFWEEYEKCGERIKNKGHGNCSPYYADYFRCIDKCVAPKLFKELK